VSLELLPPPKQPAEVAAMSLRERAEYELGQELAALLTHDTAAYPIAKDEAGGKEGGKKGKKGSSAAAAAAAAEAAGMAPVAPLEQYSLEEMQGAALLLEEEVLVVKQAMGHADTPLTEYAESFDLVSRDMVWLPGQKRYGRAVTATPAERIEAVRVEHEAVRGEMVRRAKRAAKIEQKVNILVTGLQQRAGKLQGQLGEAWEALGNTEVELECFKALQVRGVTSRGGEGPGHGISIRTQQQVGLHVRFHMSL
jgi:pre-mRNA-splicing factor CDC5/CEF1